MSKENSKKVNKRLSRHCSECGGVLVIVERSKPINGVEYFDKYVECLECGDYYPYKEKGHNKKIEFEV